MKKKIYGLLAILLIALVPKPALAAPSGSLSCSAPSTVKVGNTISVTISGNSSDEVYWDITTYSNDESKLKYSGGADSRSISNDFSKSISYTYKFKAVDVGNVTITSNGTIAGYDGIKAFPNTSCTIKVVEKGATTTKKEENNKSSDNSLKSLEIDGLTLTPEFNKDTLEYNVDIKSDEKTKIDIKAIATDSKASVEGAGEKEVDLGVNKLEINVKAENGAIRTYIINVTVSEKNPITVKLNGQKYKIMRKINGIDAPAGYEKAVIKIDNKEVEVYKSKDTNYTLVVLIDEDNKPGLYIYKNGKYTKYNEFSNGNLKLLILKPEKNVEIPYKYNEIKFKINDETIDGYALSENSRFRLVYALNLDSKEKGFYLYDLDQKTFQRFYNEQSIIYINLVKKIKTVFLIIGIGIFILFILWIKSLSKNIKLKKKYISKVEKLNNKKNNQDIQEKNFNTSKKEERKKLKEERKSFLNE